MEENIFPQPAVAGLLQDMIEARLHNDGADVVVREAIQALQKEMAASVATPIYIVVDPTTGEQLARRDGALLDAQLFADWLRDASP
jgi:hypothetical protein